MTTEHTPDKGDEMGAQHADASTSDHEIEVEDLAVKDGEEVKGGAFDAFMQFKPKP
jgi:hypothetical protein